MKNKIGRDSASIGRASALMWVPITVALALLLSAATPFLPSSSAADIPSAKICLANRTLDSIDIGKYFANFLVQARKDWHKDANISSVRLDDRLGKNFDALCKVNIYSSWTVILYSPSLKREEVVTMDGENLTAAGIPRLLYSVKKVKSNGVTFTSMTAADMKKDGSWVFDLYSRPEIPIDEKKGPENLFLNWKVSFSDLIQKFLDQIRKEVITEYGWSIYIGKRSLKTGTPYADIYWQNGGKKQAYFVEPITLKSYVVKY